jgi:formylglycine-generating enzyme required for sulfatase activity
MVVPLARIQHCTFAATGKPSSVQCRNSDRIVGLFGPKTTISFKVDKSKNADILISKIAAIVACDALVFDLGLGKGVTMKLVFVPAGKFMMGSLKTEAFRSKDEGPLREVTISKPFYMGVYEVTQAQWYTVMGTKPWKDRIDSKAGVDKAASCVNWKDAAKFCEILSKKTGKKVTLPTEAQWEYACRAGSKTTYCYSDDALKLGDYAWYSANAYRKGEMYAHAVGRLKPNVFGLYDMHGNVWEWCRDWYEEKFYAKAKNIDPENTTKPRIVCRVLRGGSWFVDPENCRSAVRSRISTVLRDGCIGFRVVVSPDTGAFGSRRQNIK